MSITRKNQAMNLKEMMITIKTHVNLDGLNSGMSKLKSQTSGLQKSMEGIGKGLSPMRDLGVGLGMGFVVKQAIDFETAMLGVSKQVQGARDASGNLTAEYYSMGEQIKQLASVSPVSPTAIADIVTAGARMGVAKEDLMGFTETSIKMATAFEAPADQLADSMGKIANVFGTPIKNIGELADTINYLDDNAISKGSDIINVLQRISGMAKTVGLSAKDAAALGSTFLSLGSGAEMAATASNALMSILATVSTNKKASEALSTMGFNPKDVQAGMVKDAKGTILKVLDAVSKVKPEQKMNILTELFGREYADDIAKLAAGKAELGKQFDMANSDGAKGSMNKEYQARLQSTSAQLEILKNNATNVAITIGSVFLPPLVSLSQALVPIVQSIGEFAQNHKELVTVIGGGLAVITGLGLILSGIVSITGMVIGGFGGLISICGGLLTAIRVVSMGIRIAFATNPVGAFVLVLAGIVTYWDEITQAIQWAIDKVKEFFSIESDHSQVAAPAIEQTPEQNQATFMARSMRSIVSPSATSNNTTSNRTNNVTNNVTNAPVINVTSTDPKGAANEISQRLRLSNKNTMTLAGASANIAM